MLVVIVGSPLKGVIAEELAEDADVLTQQKLASHLLINLLLEKVDEGGLVIFDQTLSRKDLLAEKVAYIHNVDDDSVSISITFQLRTPLAVPNYDNFFAHRICVDVDKDGNIKQVATHIGCQATPETPAESDKAGSGGEE